MSDKMKNKKIIIGIGVFCFLVFLVFSLYLFPMWHDQECKNRVYSDLQNIAEEAKKSIIGIIPLKDDYGNVMHNGLASGVIFDKKDHTYYALTAAHVLEEDVISYRVFTSLTSFSGQTVQADDEVTFIIPDASYYDSLLESKIEYVSDEADLVILSFVSQDELPVLEFEPKELSIGDRIVAIGHPEGNRYKSTYGNVLSDIKEVTLVTNSTGKSNTDKVVEHDAYLKYGNSGGVAIGESGKVVGINIGGAFTHLGFYLRGYMIPYSVIEYNLKQWKDS